MKKFFFFFLLVLILILSIFLLGFIQLRMSVGQQAMIHTKTNGWHPQIIRHGEVTWMWQPLLPTNMSLIRFTDAPNSANVQFKMSLPSWEVYGEGLPSTAFELSFDGLIEYTFSEEYYPTLFEGFFHPDSEDDFQSLAQSTLLSAHNQVTQEIRVKISNATEQVISQMLNQSNLSFGSLLAFRQTLNQAISESLSQIQGINIQSVGLTNLIIPDMEMYIQVRRTFLENQVALSNRLIEVELALSTSDRIEQSRFSMLRTYGEILTEFPGLLDYFRIIGEVGVDPLNLSDSLNNEQ